MYIVHCTVNTVKRSIRDIQNIFILVHEIDRFKLRNRGIFPKTGEFIIHYALFDEG